jgi:hypothetical protein
LFARRAQRNPYLKAAVLERDGAECAWCLRLLRGQSVLHHVDYDHHCHLGLEVRLPRPTPLRPERSVKVPDCQRCHAEHPDWFDACARRLVAVHNRCNAAIERARVTALGDEGDATAEDLDD